MRSWVDPYQGWLYGFPKEWDSDVEPDLWLWLVSEGYPEELALRVQEQGLHIRCYNTTEQRSQNRYIPVDSGSDR